MEEWPVAIDRFARITGGDVPYWYTERANSGILAGAAWRAGMIALEEYQVKKTGPATSAGPERKRKVWNGRCDLWIGSEHASVIIEAKQRWRDLSSKNFIPLCLDTLKSAVEDAKSTKGTSEDAAAGIAFVPLYIKRKKAPSVENLDKYLESVVEKCEEKIQTKEVDLVAWCFPNSMREYTNQKTKNALPGVIIFGKGVK